jgi:hypothetical protein
MYQEKKIGDKNIITTRWCYLDNPNVHLRFTVTDQSTYNSLMIIGTFYEEVKSFACSE